MPSKSSNVGRTSWIFYAYQFLISIIVLFLLYQTAFKNDRIAYVDSSKVLNEFKGSEKAKKDFQTKAKAWQANIDTMTNEVKASIGNYEKTLAGMSAKEQSMAKELIRSKQKQMSDYQQAIQDNARQEDAKLTQTVVTQINSFLTRYGKKHNYKMILIANQSGTIAYAREGLDITDEVVKELNDEYTEGSK
ncbi:OmpH family outer membrane protein [Mucilaginibacter sp. JRF]|uniref:OmpH family outer membrane protein n=1 Tax=Mucilaginibacter sp. JRF TaxID=2780088 RepID=UPI001882DA81|nr:OmpH family outer membrane protein [Mucilaginibacter sp. JRF]MBE9585996.1 OmpH family outer membrane protein [Mucilaginibacter sp. JRF]